MNSVVLHGALTQVLALLAVVAAVFALGWAARRVSRRVPGARAPVKVVGGAAVGTRERVVVLELGTTWLVVGVAPGRVSALHTMPKLDTPVADAPSAVPDNPFSAWLSKTIARRSTDE